MFEFWSSTPLKEVLRPELGTGEQSLLEVDDDEHSNLGVFCFCPVNTAIITYDNLRAIAQATNLACYNSWPIVLAVPLPVLLYRVNLKI